MAFGPDRPVVGSCVRRSGPWLNLVGAVVSLLACSAQVPPRSEPSPQFQVSAKVVDRSGREVSPGAAGLPDSNPALTSPLQAEQASGNGVVRGKTQPLEPPKRELYFPDLQGQEEPRRNSAVTEDQAFLAGIVTVRRDYPEEGLINGQQVFAMFREADGACGTVAVTYPAFYQGEIWHACPDGQASRVSGAEDLPGVPEEGQFAAQRQFLIHTAYVQGRADARMGDYQIIARALGVAGADGCILMESDVLWRGAVIDVARESVCAQAQ